MYFNLLSRFICWLKKIFRIRQGPISGKQIEVPPEKNNEGKSKVPPTQQKSPEPPPKEEIVITKPGVVEDTKVIKPNTKKPPKEDKKRGKKQSVRKKKPTISESMTEIDLGKYKSSGGIKQQTQPSKESLKKTSSREEGKETSVRIQSPYVELDLDEAKVFLVIPEQQFETNAESNIPKELHYKLEINGNIEDIPAKVSSINIPTVEEKRIELTQPLNILKITYPNELQGRVYSYKHLYEILYPFIAIGNNRGRMYYLYDKGGNMNPLPKKSVWILLEESFEVPDVDIIEERWIWERYQPLKINLKNNEELIIRNRQTEEEKKIPCKPSFSIECDIFIEDDFKDISPLITGKWIKIIAPRENPLDWIVEVQNKQVGPKSWTGEKPLELKLPDDLPCECGEFQVDICEQEDSIPKETLFFRYIPCLQLKFPRDLIVPDPNKGHKEETVEILFGKDFQNWELKNEETVMHENIKNGFQIKLPPQQDVIRFSLMKKDKPETETSIRITIPRLKWRTSKSETWHDRPIQIRRDELITGADFYLTVCTNDFDTQYELLAILETTSEKLQEAKFNQKGRYYNLLLNQFYDTIKENNDKILLRMEIRKAIDNEIVGQTEVIHLPEVVQEGSKDTLLRIPKAISTTEEKRLIKPHKRRDIRANVKAANGRFRTGKGFSKKEVKEAGISMGSIKIKGLRIPVDKRRKSMYTENIEILKSLMGSK
jgi:ribosomal protein L13E